MESERKTNSKVGMKYKRITKETRIRLLEMTKDKKMTVKKASEEVGLSPSTARSIICKFHEEGEIFVPKAEKIQV